MLGRALGAALGLLLVVALGTAWWVRSAARPQVDGTMSVPGPGAPVTVLRDDLGIPYIFAANTPDLLLAQGFVTAQHRLMQMELYRAIWKGELAAAFGARALPSDIRMRVLGISRNGIRHAEKLAPESWAYLQKYADGINAYVVAHASDHPLELRVAGLKARPWSVADLVTLIHFVHYSHAANFKAEVVAQMLIDRLGFERAHELFPQPANPDGANLKAAQSAPPRVAAARADWATLGIEWDDLAVAPETLGHQGLGSNNWAVGPTRTLSGRAMLGSDPHLDNRLLPGTWHPVGLITPEIQAVGAALPGMPGLLVGRTKHVAFAGTNAYGDVQDLYIETVDPADANRYLDGGRSVPFDVVTETIAVKDGDAPAGAASMCSRSATRDGEELYREIALGTYGDELGEPLANEMLTVWYFWQQGFDALVATPDSPWFDDVRTPERRETLADVIRAAAPRVRTRLAAAQGADPSAWRWGKAHTLRFASPLRREGAGGELLGGFTVERSGSGETLDRGVYEFASPFDVTFFASLQLVVDFGDPDKIEAILAGGVNERHFQPHQNDQ